LFYTQKNTKQKKGWRTRYRRTKMARLLWSRLFFKGSINLCLPNIHAEK